MEEKLDERVERFLDADTLAEKYDIAIAFGEIDITDYFIDTMATSLDVVIPEGDLYERYRQLLGAIRTKMKYEIRRG